MNCTKYGRHTRRGRDRESESESHLQVGDIRVLSMTLECEGSAATCNDAVEVVLGECLGKQQHRVCHRGVKVGRQSSAHLRVDVAWMGKQVHVIITERGEMWPP